MRLADADSDRRQPKITFDVIKLSSQKDKKLTPVSRLASCYRLEAKNCFELCSAGSMSRFLNEKGIKNFPNSTAAQSCLIVIRDENLPGTCHNKNVVCMRCVHNFADAMAREYKCDVLRATLYLFWK